MSYTYTFQEVNIIDFIYFIGATDGLEELDQKLVRRKAYRWLMYM